VTENQDVVKKVEKKWQKKMLKSLAGKGKGSTFATAKLRKECNLLEMSVG